MEPAIEAENLSVYKERRPVLQALNFDVSAGSITGLIGPSGSGKTTLMRAIVGVQKTGKGALEVLGEKAGSKRLRSKIGYVTQDASIYGDLSVIQNIRYFATLVRAEKSQVEDVIKQVRLTEQRNQLVASLSGGQRARVSLAVALLGHPDLLVLDEPTVGLDPVLRRELWQLFQELADEGKTLVISSHVMDEAERCKSLLLLRDGKLLWHGPRVQLLKASNAPSVEEAFVTMVKKEGK